MRNILRPLSLLAVFCILTFAGSIALAADISAARIKDIAKVEGVRSNQLVGYGLVVGLQGSGDTNKTLETLSSVANMLKSFGVSVDTATLKTKNVAAVMVTATLPPFAHAGDNIDFTASSMGDAKSLSGGVLLQTPLKAGNGQVYAVAQGPIATGGYSASGRSKNITTVGTASNGAIVEQTVEDTLGQNGNISFSLDNADFSTASRIAGAINANFGGIASAASPGRVDVTIPSYYRNNIVGFVSDIENLSVVPDSPAKVVVNERTGTIVMGGNISVDKVAIAQGGLSISIDKTTDVYQPSPYSMGNTIVTKNTNTKVNEQKANTIVLNATASVNDVVGALNAVGATPRDIIAILQAMKTSGALHADLQVI
ncbi:flagellar basal body P-ring protein FlgI [Pectinatus frisingensis]|uniref:flagellar basal body P-ring protein FlgI n=1 Tax=Pectinatus frisingensis TaxID=865 RepID=UPI0018C7FA97|nr:flagellar basal body P-ring protein FlgI [Pectinatus frisingensis]